MDVTPETITPAPEFISPGIKIEVDLIIRYIT
jgi:hypothetical protein